MEKLMTDLHTKRCVKCCVVQTIDNFGPSKKTKDRLFPYCRECKRASDRASNARHRDERNAAAKAKYAANPEPGKAKSRERYRKDPAKWKAEALAWSRANPAKRKVSAAAWQRKNLHGVVREYTRRRYATRKGAVAMRGSHALQSAPDLQAVQFQQVRRLAGQYRQRRVIEGGHKWHQQSKQRKTPKT